MQFVLITRTDLEDTNRLFRAACVARDMNCAEVVPGSAAMSSLGQGPRLVYCAAADWNARLIEKLVLRPGDAALHDPHFVCDHQPIRLASAGIPMARGVYVPDPDRLQHQVDWLGGFPVVLKRPGTEGGRGVALIGDMQILRDALGSAVSGAMLETYIPHDLCWRLTVLNGTVLAASASRAPDGDFRTNVPGGHRVENAVLPDGARDLAIRAVAALKLSFGGVDLMQAHDGALYIAEVNFPCYFADQQDLLSIDIAGAIIEYLAARVTGSEREV